MVFLTVATEKRRPWLACAEAHAALHTVWKDAAGWLVGNYMLMPDHLHCICVPGPGDFAMERWIAYWKHAFWKKTGHPEWKWQSRGWHHRLRSDESWEAKWNYIHHNPVRAGLACDPAEWPFQGRVHDLGLTHL